MSRRSISPRGLENFPNFIFVWDRVCKIMFALGMRSIYEQPAIVRTQGVENIFEIVNKFIGNVFMIEKIISMSIFDEHNTISRLALKDSIMKEGSVPGRWFTTCSSHSTSSLRPVQEIA
jgi:hypothetical protein